MTTSGDPDDAYAHARAAVRLARHTVGWRRWKQVACAALAALCGACSGNSPVAPSPTPTPTPTPTYTVAGTLTATNGGQPLAGVQALLGATVVTTDAAGGFSATLPQTGTYILSLHGPSIVDRGMLVGLTGSRTVRADAIALGGGFDLGFYRKLIRNDFDAPGQFQPLRRWTRTPSFYVKTADEGGHALTEATLALIESVLRDGVPRWTSGMLGAPTIERGAGTREGQAGWITVKYPFPGSTGHCGSAQVGVDGGWIELETAPVGINCRVPSSLIAARTVRHELGHALGFYHTDSAADLMHGGDWTDGDQQPSARELYHAAIAYRRPVGNSDPDTDPASAVNLSPMRVY